MGAGVKFLSVCSGIEAASVAWLPLGFECIGHSEIEPFPCKVLKHHYPGVKNYGDLTKWRDWNVPEKPDIIVGGTPCQDFSIAGKRQEGERANLTFEFIRMAGEIRPEWVVWENVPGVLSMGSGRTFFSILREFSKCGYGVAWRILDAQYFGIPQRRRRVFLIGHSSGDPRRAGQILFEQEGLRRDIEKSREEGKEITRGPFRCANQLDLGTWEESEQAVTIMSRDAKSARTVAFTQNDAGRDATENKSPTLRSGGDGGIPQMCVAIDLQRRYNANNEECNNADANKERDCEKLSVLWKSFTEEEVLVWCIRVTSTFWEEKVLWESLYVKDVYEQALENLMPEAVKSEGEKEVTSWRLRSVRSGKRQGRTPQRPQSIEQLHRQLTKNLSVMPQQGTSQRAFLQALWRQAQGTGVLRKALSSTEEVWRSTNQVCNRGWECICRGRREPMHNTRVCEEAPREGVLLNAPRPEHKIRRITVIEALRLQGFPDSYLKDVTGYSDTQAYRAIGNSKAVPVVRWIGERIKRACITGVEKRKNGKVGKL